MANASEDHEADSGSTSAVTEGGGAPEEDVERDNDTDRVTVSTCDSADATNTSNNSSGLRCDRCDIFEAPNRKALTVHMAQCQPPAAAENDEPEMKVENNNPPPDRVHRKMFECDVCNMKFSNGANMRRHKMRHTGVKPYECRVCQKRFFRKDHLAEHFTTHTKTLPYHCPICNRGFQRQIAMRAHFQNEHVGQHDLVKSCPLCSYRAGSMKSLRVHFFNRHGIDLDNPGPAGSSASLLAAATQHMTSMEGALSTLGSLSVSVAANYSDSGDSTGARSADNATPPMHFLTPHVEISMADAPASFSPIQCDQPRPLQGGDSAQQNGECPGSPHSADSNSNAPSSSHAQSTPLRIDETNITPSISLIPIKQEPSSEESYDKNRNSINGGGGGGAVNLSTSPSGSVQMQSATSSSLSMIKVSPLKSLLREDLKRKIVSRSSSSRARSTVSPSPNQPESSPGEPAATTTNGTITSTASEQPSDSSWRAAGKRVLSSLQCIFCGIGFPDQTLYFLHKGCHSDSNPWKCNICGEQCSNVYEFNSHLLSKSHQ